MEVRALPSAESPRSAVSNSIVSSGQRAASEAAPVNQQNEASTSAIARRVRQHGQWALLSQSQQQLSLMQRADQEMASSGRVLVRLLRLIEQQPEQTTKMATLAKQWATSVTTSQALNPDLSAKQSVNQQTYILDRVQLLATRPQAEQINVRLPNQQTLQLQLPAGASTQQLMANILPQLVRAGLQPEITPNGLLSLTGEGSLFSQSWLFQGQGIRVPAGNPVPIPLTFPDAELQQLVEGLDAGRLAAEKQRIRMLMKALERHRQRLHFQRQQLLAQAYQLNQGQGIAGEQLSQALKATLQSSDFAGQMRAIMAQANTSRQMVVALLSLTSF